MQSGNPFAGRVSSLSDDDFALLSSAVAERACRDRYGFGTLAEAAAEYRPDPPCPTCGAHAAFKDGNTPSGLARYRCRVCGKRYDSLTGTVLECCKKDLTAWVDFINLMRFNVPLDAAAEICRISHQTAFEWRHRVFATVDGYQDRLLLSGTIWLDETYINDTDLAHGFDEARKRGLSKQKPCIAVAIDSRKTPVAVVCGHGKPYSKRMKEGLLAHIEEGSHIIHGREKSHNAPIGAARCTDDAYKADVRDPERLDCLAMVNNLCSWLKRYLWRFTGMDPKNLQSYLNWYVYLFRVKQANERWPETERVVRHLLMCDARFRSSRSRDHHPFG